MITPMKRITVCGVQKDRKSIMEALQKIGCVEFIRQSSEEGISSHPDVSERITQFDRYISAAFQAIEVLDDFLPEKKGMFSVRKSISINHYSMNPGEISTVGSMALDIISYKKKISDNILSIGKHHAKISAIEPWLTLDVPMNTSGTEMTSAFLLTCPMEVNTGLLEGILGDLAKFVYYEIEYSSKNVSNVFFIVLKDYEEEVQKLLRENSFAVSQTGLSHRTPEKKIENIKSKIQSLEEENKELKEKIISLAAERDSIKLLYDHLTIRKEKYLNLQNLLVTDEAFVIEGYIPSEQCAKAEKRLESAGFCSVEFSQLSDDEEAPVLFKNNSFVKPVENITSDYSMPSKHDIDPNAVMSIFYYAFFGMMFSDAGYGLLMMLVCGFIGFIAKVENSTKQFMRMFFYCGLSTFIWGILFGSFFGDAVK